MTEISSTPQPDEAAVPDALGVPEQSGLGVPEQSGSAPPGELEGAMSMIEETEGLIGDVEAALERLESGQYRSCEICGASLDDATLTAAPILRRCLVHTA